MVTAEAVVFPFYFTWRNNPVRETLYGKKCRIVATGTMNSVSLEFESGEQVVTSRYSLRAVDSGWRPTPSSAARPRNLVHCSYCGKRRRRSRGRLGFVSCEACQDQHPVCLDGCTKAPLVCRGMSPNVKVVLKRCPPPKE